MISEKRISKAYNEGFNAYLVTKGNPERTMNPYTRQTSQWKSWNKGWNQARRDSKAIVKNTNHIHNHLTKA